MMFWIVPLLLALLVGSSAPTRAGAPKFFFGSTAQNIAEIVERVALAEAVAPFLYVPIASGVCEGDAMPEQPCHIVRKTEHSLEQAAPKQRILVVRVYLTTLGTCSGFKERLAELTLDPRKLTKYLDKRGERYTGTARGGFDAANNQFDPNRPNSSFNLRLLAKGKFEAVDCAKKTVVYKLILIGQMLL